MKERKGKEEKEKEGREGKEGEGRKRRKGKSKAVQGRARRRNVEMYSRGLGCTVELNCMGRFSYYV